MSRNFYILAATFFFFALVSFALMWSSSNPQSSDPGDAALWHTIALVILLFALMAALIGTIIGLYEQARRRYEERQQRSGRR